MEEVGAMNIFFKIDGKVYTANAEEQDGTVLPGVTRRSIIELLRDWGYEVVEGKLAIDTVMAAARRESWRRFSAPARPRWSLLSSSWIMRINPPSSTTVRSVP